MYTSISSVLISIPFLSFSHLIALRFSGLQCIRVVRSGPYYHVPAPREKTFKFSQLHTMLPIGFPVDEL